jgi:uncharacterized GH25 family protein
MNKLFLTSALLAVTITAAQAHDTWVETNTSIFRLGDGPQIDLKLGNHGNEHRDFKLASKLSLEGSTLQVLAPEGAKFDIKTTLIDTGYSPREGYWTTTFAPSKPGLYTVVQTSDSVMSYAPERSIKTAKTFFLVSNSLDRISTGVRGYNTRLRKGLELVAESNPVAPMGPGVPFKVQLLFKGKALPNTRISFIPQGATLKGDFDKRYEAKTNVNGRAVFTPKEGKRYLLAAHYETKEKGYSAAGEKYDFTKYSATMSLFVPQVCPCCAR